MASGTWPNKQKQYEEEEDRGEFHELEHFDDKMEKERKMVRSLLRMGDDGGGRFGTTKA